MTINPEKQGLFLKSLTIENFKGIDKLHIQPEHITRYAGYNKTGKTTIADAFTWLLTGKDTLDQADFDIKPLDKDNNPIHHLITRVEAECLMNGNPLYLKKEYKEDWTTPREKTELELTGHTKDYYWDSPSNLVNESVFTSRLKEYFDPEFLKIITNPLYFISVMKKDRRRAELFKLATNLPEDEILKMDKKFKPLLEAKRSLTVDEYRTALKKDMAKLDKKKKEYQPRIDENQQKIVPDEHNTEYYNNLISEYMDVIKSEQEAIEIIKSDNGIVELREKRAKLSAQIRSDKLTFEMRQDDIEREFDRKRKELDDQISDVKEELDETAKAIKENHEQIESDKKAMASLRERFAEIRDSSAPELEEDKMSCPTCNRMFESTDLLKMQTELIENHKEWKANELEKVNERGTELKDSIGIMEIQIKEMRKKEKTFSSELKELQEQRDTMVEPEHEEFRSSMEEELKKLDNQIENSPDIDELIKEHREKIEEMKTAINECNDNKLQLQNNNKYQLRIKTLVGEMEKAGKDYSKMKAMSDLIDDFTRYQAEKIESSVNELFTFCKWKLFNIQLNGGVESVCDVMVDGVPYKSMNQGSRKKAGLDVINVFCKKNNTCAPIFIDEAGEIKDIPETFGQQIQLYVTADEKLSLMTEEDYQRMNEFKTNKPLKLGGAEYGN